MPIKITMPALSPTMEEGTLARWLKQEGDAIEAGDVIAEIETDKATMEFEAVDEGVLGKILIADGTSGVKVNEPIAVMLEEGEEASSIDAFLSSPGAPASAAPISAPTKTVSTSKTQAAPMMQKNETGNRIFASPLAKRIAAQMGIDLSQIQGSGPRGRIVKADIQSGGATAAPVMSTTPAAPHSAPVTSSGPDAKAMADMLGMEYEEQPNSMFRKTVAKRLLESKQTVPHFYLTVECQIDNLLAARKNINAQANGEYKLSVNDFVVKACANALNAYPAANTAWTEAAILQFKHADISVAVATPNGLITPVVRKAEQKGMKEISAEIKDLASRARDGKLKPEEYQGGSFTISNLGMFGIQSFGAIINPPQSCILAVGAGEQKPYVDNGEIKIGTFMHCTLSVDHRSVDGAVGAEYLKILKGYIENPVSMLV